MASTTTPRGLAASAAVALLAAYTYSTFFACPAMQNVRGSTVLITGSSSGIGEELAYQYGALGARLVLAARRASELERVAATARERGALDVLVVPTDMGDSQAVESLIGRALSAFGRLDTLVLNHAAFDDQFFLHYNDSKSLEDQLMFQMRVNVLGCAQATRAALPHLEKTGGHIAVVSSGSAKIAAPFHPLYVTTKKALHGFFDTVRHELHLVGSRVTVGLLVLGMIATPEVIRDEALKPLAMPVPDCAASMICSIQRRNQEMYIPQWMGPWTAVTYLHPWLSETTMNHFYLFNVPRYVDTIAAVSADLESKRGKPAAAAT
jgi:short-subunit dehydrogenase